MVLISTKDGNVIQNLTGGFDKDWENLELNSEFVAGRSLAFDPSGDNVGFFGKTGKGRSFFLISALDGRVKKKVHVALDETQAPCLLPDGKTVLFAALKDGLSDIYQLDIDSGTVQNLTRDEYADNDPQISPDGKLVVYERRISGNNKLYAFPLADPSHKTQLTFGPFDDTAPIFSADGHRLYYASDEDDDIPNLRSLDLRTGAIQQYTDVFGGAMAPAPLKTPRGDRLAFITYYKGEFKLHTRDTTEPIKEVDQEVQAAAEGLVDFQPDVPHEVVPENKRRKKLFEGLYLEGRPPINVGVTSSGNFYGGTSIVLTDVLGDQQFALTVLSVSSYRIYDGRYTNLASRLHYGVNFYDQTYFFYPYYSYYPGYYGQDPRDLAIATQRFTGGQVFAEYPFNTFRRLEFGVGLAKVQEQYGDAQVQDLICEQAAVSGLPCFVNNGWQAPVSLAAWCRRPRASRSSDRSPAAPISVGVTAAPGIGSFLQRTTVDADLRKYLRLGGTSRAARRARPRLLLDRRQPRLLLLRRQHGAARLPVPELRGQPGLLRERRAAPAADPPGGDADRDPRPAARHDVLRHRRGPLQRPDLPFSTSDPGYSYVEDPIYGTPVTGWRLQDGRASWGFGLQLFFLGYPMHFDWTKYTDFATTSKGWDFNFWIGYDF